MITNYHLDLYWNGGGEADLKWIIFYFSHCVMRFVATVTLDIKYGC